MLQKYTLHILIVLLVLNNTRFIFEYGLRKRIIKYKISINSVRESRTIYNAHGHSKVVVNLFANECQETSLYLLIPKITFDDYKESILSMKSAIIYVKDDLSYIKRLSDYNIDGFESGKLIIAEEDNLIFATIIINCLLIFFIFWLKILSVPRGNGSDGNGPDLLVMVQICWWLG